MACLIMCVLLRLPPMRAFNRRECCLIMHTCTYSMTRLWLLPASLFIGHCCRQQPVSNIAPAEIDPYDSKGHNKFGSKGTTQKELCCLQPKMCGSVLLHGIHVTALQVY